MQQIFFITATLMPAIAYILIASKIKQYMSNTSVSLEAIKAQLLKAKGEIVAKIQALEDSIAINNDNLSDESQKALDDLKTIAQQFDDIVPDAPVENPTDGGDQTPSTQEPAEQQ
jgi:hypothetical protein